MCMKHSFLFLLEFLVNIKDTFLSVIRIFIKSKIFKKRQSCVKDSSCYILANGPSMKSVLRENCNFFSNKEVFVVNDFVLSDYYERVKPSYYVFADPLYWMEDKKVSESIRSQRNTVLQLILNKTNWMMNVYIPSVAYSTRIFQEKFKKNTSIQVCFYNTAGVNGFDCYKRIVFNLGLGMPLVQNVLIGTIGIALFLDFKKIYIYGADHSWTKDLVVNRLNEVCLLDSHFYDGDLKLSVWKKVDGNPYKMHEILLDLHNVFVGYHELKKIALSKNAKIINCTKDSFIDAFERDVDTN